MKTRFPDTAGHALEQAVVHNDFFTQVALRARFGKLGGWQRGQVDVEPQPISRKIVPQSQAFPSKEGLRALPELFEMPLCKSIQGARQCGLFSKPHPSPGLSENQIGSQARVYLRNGAASGQNTDQHVKQFLARRMVNGF